MVRAYIQPNIQAVQKTDSSGEKDCSKSRGEGTILKEQLGNRESSKDHGIRAVLKTKRKILQVCGWDPYNSET